MNKSAFIKNINIPESLALAVIKQVGGWEAFKEMAQDVANHGADGGFSGFIYYSDTVPFAQKNRQAIKQYAAEMASGMGEEGAYSLIKGFNCFKGEYSVDEIVDAMASSEDDNHTQVMNALAWFALEETSRSYADLMEA